MQLLLQAERIENFHRIRSDLQTGAYFFELGGTFVHLDLEAALAKRHGSGETTDAGAYDHDPKRPFWACSRHLLSFSPLRGDAVAPHSPPQRTL